LLERASLGTRARATRPNGQVDTTAIRQSYVKPNKTAADTGAICEAVGRFVPIKTREQQVILAASGQGFAGATVHGDG
jgi:hypothetical protein